MSWWSIDETHDPERTSWLACTQGHDEFPIQNLPLGIFARPGGAPRAGVAIGSRILDLRACADAGLLPPQVAHACTGEGLNDLLGLPGEARQMLRKRVSRLLSDRSEQSRLEPLLHRAADCSLFLPARIGDFTDFYVGIHHATNVGRLFRPENPLLPNYKYVPIGYHGRASSVRPSGVPLRRPKGQIKAPDRTEPVVAASSRLDYELEMGVWIGPGNEANSPIPIGDAAKHIAGFCLLNDWSARDFQSWEYQPLGPFLSKSFHTTISPWVITAEALAPFRTSQPPRPADDPRPLPYLLDSADQAFGGLSICLEAYLATKQMREAGFAPFRLSTGPATSMYWTVQQMVAHHSSNGCNLSPGDLLGTGTISAPIRTGFGSLLELTDGGSRPIPLPGGEERTFLADGDEIMLRARAHAPGFVSIGFGECRATVEAAG